MKPFTFFLITILASAITSAATVGTLVGIKHVSESHVRAPALQAQPFHNKIQQCWVRCPRCSYPFYANVPVKKLGDTGFTIGEVLPNGK